MSDLWGPKILIMMPQLLLVMYFVKIIISDRLLIVEILILSNCTIKQVGSEK